MNKWPKILPPLSPKQHFISNDFMKHWHEILATRTEFSLIEKFNHNYAAKHTSRDFLTTLEIGAGIGEHLKYEKLTPEQKQNYVALELRQNMAEKIKKHHPEITVQVGDCQTTLPYKNNYFDRILGIHILEHLPNLPATIKEMHRLCNKNYGTFSVVIPCEGSLIYTLGRRISAQRIFERRYQQSYQWFIEREHINKPNEIIEEINPYFTIEHRCFFPFAIPIINFNLCIGMTLRPKKF